MRLHQMLAPAFIALGLTNGAAFAEVTVSQSNDPTALIGQQLSSLMGAEHSAVGALADAKLNALATGPAAAAPATARPQKAKAQKAAPGQPVLMQYNAAWLMSQPEPKSDAQWECLRRAIYHEARGESIRGQFAVAEVILNRVDSGDYPGSVCGVVQQGCQFSYTCDGASDALRDPYPAELAGRIARVMLDGAPRGLTTGATHFHTRAVWPGWSRQFPQTAAIGAHLFYRAP